MDGESGEDLVSHLQVMGLNLYESRAYLALLGGKQLSAKQIGQLALIPQSRTYDVLESLAAKGFALGTPSTPKLYTSVPFERVIPSLYQTKKREIQLGAARVEEEAQEKLDELTGAYDQLMEDLEHTSLTDLNVPEPVWIVEGRKNIEKTIVSLIQGAKKDIMRVTRPPDLRGSYPMDPFYLWTSWTHMLDAVERGVKVRWLSLLRELPSYPGLRVTEPPERRFLERDEEIIEKFFLADDADVLLNLYDPKLSAFGSIAMLMHSKAACSVFRENFDATWDRAKTLQEVLPGVRAKVSQACTAMADAGYSKTEVTLYRVMAEIGACTEEEMVEAVRKRRIERADAVYAFAKLAKANIVHKNKAITFSMVENPDVVLEMLRSPRS